MDFLSLDLPEPVMQGVREAGFVTATPIQEVALPLALKGKDRKSTRLNSSHIQKSRMPSSA